MGQLRQFFRRNWIWLVSLALGSFTILWTAWGTLQANRRVDRLEIRVERLELAGGGAGR